ncbi:MAG: acylhydrolase [Chitinophagaceae bacterium]|nr:MAG: acylhydrolase [Chitinophagaceae bacterium]
MFMAGGRLHGQTDNTTDTAAQKEDFRDDWADLRHYESVNKTLAVPASGEKRVVFLGSSIFENWSMLEPSFWKNKSYVNRGISGQISPQLLVRFKQDVINLKPAVVIILAGSNDISGSTGHVTNERILNNIGAMAELATANRIRVIVCAYLPVFDYPWRKGIEPARKIIALNKEIKKFVERNRLTLLDYFTPFADERNGQQQALSLDGVHPNQAGYKAMAPVTEKAIRSALQKPLPTSIRY